MLEYHHLDRKHGENMNITDIRMKKINNDSKMKAVASITIDGAFVIHDVRVIDGAKGLFVAMPSKKDQDGTHRDICHPINAETRLAVKELVLAKYDEVVALEEEYDVDCDAEDDTDD